MASTAHLGEFEQMVLLAILQCGDEAYGPAISAELEARADRSVSRGALYSALRRLEAKGQLRWHLEPPAPNRGGHAARRFEVTETGLASLRAYRSALENLWAGLEDVVGGAS